MLKKVGIVTAVAAAGALTFGGIAFAHDDGGSDSHVYNHPVKECGHSFLEGVLALPSNDNSTNDDSHHGDCKQ